MNKKAANLEGKKTTRIKTTKEELIM